MLKYPRNLVSNLKLCSKHWYPSTISFLAQVRYENADRLNFAPFPVFNLKGDITGIRKACFGEEEMFPPSFCVHSKRGTLALPVFE